MYDRPETVAANDRFWNEIKAQLGEGPDALTRGLADYWPVWQSPELLFSQTCGMPYRTRLHGTVQLVGTPDYGLDGCPPGYYRSIFVARAADAGQPLENFAGRTMAYNEALSQSGWAAPMNHMAPMGIRPGQLLQSGGHAASARSVAEGRADFAALDALTWELLKAYDGFASGLVEIAVTAPTPALPFITAQGRDAEQLGDAVEAAIRNLDPKDREILHLKGLIRIPATAYLEVANPPPPEEIAPAAA
jgi:ABC-type phosphate/phosphonate transport system substrate-binding protein